MQWWLNAFLFADFTTTEPQTRKLFEVCRMRRLPLFTFVNKLDRPALTPYEIMDQIEGKEDIGRDVVSLLCVKMNADVVF